MSNFTDELWEKYAISDWRVEMTKDEFLAALKEYGAAVRAQDVKMLRDRLTYDGVASAIEATPLP